jgi:predicted peptidase
MRAFASRLGFLTVAILLMTSSTNAETGSAGAQTENTFSQTITREVKLDYLLFLPADYDASRETGWPMILFLHGRGERGTDLDLVKIHGPAKLVEKDPDFPFIVVSPQCPDDRIWDSPALIGLLDAVIAAHNVDTNRIYLTGLSMGGFGTWDLGLKFPERFAAMVPVCGGGNVIEARIVGEQREKEIARLPIWAFHGAKDDVIPLSESERMVDVVRNVGNKDVKLTVYPEAGHDAWTQAYGSSELYDWMLQQSR